MLRAATLVLGLSLAGPAAADTLLHLSESARVMVRPDELVAVLRAEAMAPAAAEAQAQVNAAMAGAVALARQSAGVKVTTGAYSVWPRDATRPIGRQDWRASQTLTLRGTDGVALLTLVGTLQQRGLAVAELDWQMSAETARAAHAEATKQALAALRARADEAAGILGLRFDSFRDIRLGVARQQPMPVLRQMAAPMSEVSAPPPTVEAADVPVEASVEADVVLK